MSDDNRSPVKPVFAQTDVAICVVSSEEYAPFAAVTITSIVANSKPEKTYDIVVFSSDMANATQKRIRSLSRRNISIRVIDVLPFIQGLEFYTCAGISANTYYRLLAPDIFAAYDKILYIDSDTVVNRDLGDLFELELGDNFMAEARDSRALSFVTRKVPLEKEIHHFRNQLGLKDITRYYQGGVALYNLKKLRETYERGYLIKEATARQYEYMDQDLTNVLFEGKILELPMNWNVMVGDHHGRVFEAEMGRAEDVEEYAKARMEPWVVHYVTKMMPSVTEVTDLEEYFWRYARHSPFYGEILGMLAKTEMERYRREARARVESSLINMV